MLLLKQNINKKKQVDENNATKLDAGNKNSGKYKIEAICNSAVYTRESELVQLLGLYYVIF